MLVDCTIRTGWDDYFINLAHLVSSRSTCKRAQHGSILVRDRAIISTGYNGAPKNVQDCTTRTICTRVEMQVKAGTQYELCHAVHSEQNAIALAARNGARTEGATLYVTGLPCLICTRLLINAGIAKVVYDITSGRYPDSTPLDLMRQAGIEIVGWGHTPFNH